MTKAELISVVAAEVGVTKKAAGEAVDATFAAIEGALLNGEKFTFTGFGTFQVKARAEREGRNPQTGEAITIPARNVVTFKAGKALKDAVK